MRKGAFIDCGNLFKITIPAARAAVVFSLSKEGISQSDIAKRLGITQPAVNKYLKMSHSGKIKTLQKFILKKKMEKGAVKMALMKKKAIVHQIDMIAANKNVVNEAAKL